MKKVVAIVLSAILFGTLAGGTMVGINVLAHKSMPELSAPAQTEAALSETEAETESKAAKEETAPVTSKSTAELLDVSDIVEGAMPQVVSITNTMLIKQRGYGSLFDYFYGGGVYEQEYEVPSSGSGVILQKTDDELLIVTNNHVVADSNELSVTFIDGETVNAAIKGTDSTIDLAVIAVKLSDIKPETMDQIQVAKLHTEEDLEVGEGVIAIGNALGFGQSVTVGYISALDREIQTEDGTNSNLIQVDAAINPGNSGGALLNMQGEVIGINVAKYAKTEVEGVGYSIPVYKAVSVIEGLSSAKTRVEVAEENQGRLGVYMTTVSKSQADMLGMPQGVIITGFTDELMRGYTEDDIAPSAAKEAGLLKNDIITKFDGQTVATAEELQRLVKYYEAGSTITITYMRLENGEYQEKTAEVTLKAKEQSAGAEGAENGTGTPSLGVPDNGLGEADGEGKETPKTPETPEETETPEGEGNPKQPDDVYELFKEFMEQYQ